MLRLGNVAKTSYFTIATIGYAFCYAAIGCSDAGRRFPDEYRTVSDLEADLAALSEGFPAIAAMRVIGTSAGGRTLWALKVSDNVSEDEEEPVVFFEGGIHGGELIGTEVVLRIADHLCRQYGRDPEVTARVDGAEVWFLPLVNPDGRARVEKGNFSHEAMKSGRKNGRDNGGGCIGVDLNRNFDYRFLEAGSAYPCHNNYRGPEPFSEPETRAVRDLLYSYPPSVTLHYHSFHELMYYADATGDPDLEQQMLDLALGMGDAIRETSGHHYPPRGDGSLGFSSGWAAVALGVPAVVVELRPDNKDDVGVSLGGFALPVEEIEPTLTEQIPAAMFAIDWALARR